MPRRVVRSCRLRDPLHVDSVAANVATLATSSECSLHGLCLLQRSELSHACMNLLVNPVKEYEGRENEKKRVCDAGSAGLEPFVSRVLFAHMHVFRFIWCWSGLEYYSSCDTKAYDVNQGRLVWSFF
jgi:hypothetical protein